MIPAQRRLIVYLAELILADRKAELERERQVDHSESQADNAAHDEAQDAAQIES